MKRIINTIMILLWTLLAAIVSIPLWLIAIIGSILKTTGQALQQPFYWISIYVVIVNQKLGDRSKYKK